MLSLEAPHFYDPVGYIEKSTLFMDRSDNPLRVQEEGLPNLLAVSDDVSERGVGHNI